MKEITTLLITLIPYLTFAQDCSDVKTGNFRTENNNTGGSILILTDTNQEEIIESVGVHIIYDLQRTDDCNYILYNGRLIKGDPWYEGQKTDTLFVEITQINDDGYEFKSKANFSDFTSSGKAKKEMN